MTDTRRGVELAIAPPVMAPKKVLAPLKEAAPEEADLPIHTAMQGRSLWPLLRGDADRFRDDVYCEYYNAMPWHTNPQAHATMVRTERHKIVRHHGSNEGELYDLLKDPLERRNLWADPTFGALRESMLARLCDRMAWTVDPWPPRQADW